MKSLRGLGSSKKCIARTVLNDRIVEFEIYNLRKELKFDVWVIDITDESQGFCSSFPTFDEAYNFYNECIN